MVKLPDSPIIDFSGGIRNDRSDLQKRRNEVEKIINFDIDDIGRVSKRLGGFQMGDTGTGNIENSFYWERRTLGAAPASFFIVNDDSSGGNISNLVGTRVTTAIAAGATTIQADTTADFDASGDIEIEGDLISYSGKTGSSFTGVTGVTSAHVVGAAIHQRDLITNAVNCTSGGYYASLNNILYMNGRNTAAGTFDGTSYSAIVDTDHPAGIFATTYRQRIYKAGDGSGDAARARNGSRSRVSFCEPGDPTDWGNYLNNFFDVEDDRGEEITGLHASLSDELLIFKTNSFFAYNEVTLKQRNKTVGAYNQKVIKEIDGAIYTFSPAGIFVTNGSEVKKISDPVEDWLQDFIPIREDGSINRRVIENTFAGVYQKNYCLYIGDVSTVGTYTDVVLVYNTEMKNWTIYTGMTDLRHLNGFKAFTFGGGVQKFEGLFGGDASGKFYRFYSKKYLDGGASGDNKRFVTGGEIYKDMISDTGTPVEAQLESKLYEQGSPNVFKQFMYLRIIGEDRGLEVFYKLEDQKGISDWKKLGQTQSTNHRFRFPDTAKGYRVAVKITHIDPNSAPTFNAAILEETDTIPDKR